MTMEYLQQSSVPYPLVSSFFSRGTSPMKKKRKRYSFRVNFFFQSLIQMCSKRNSALKNSRGR